MLYNSYSSYLKKKYNKRLYRVGLDAGFSCPNRTKEKHGGCIFCDGTGSVAVYQREEEKEKDKADTIFLQRLNSIEDQIKRGVKFLTYRYKAELFALYFQSFSNTYAPLDELKKVYDKALSCYDFKELVIATRPDLINDEVLSLLKTYKKETWIELGLQSSNEKTLEKINRGHSLDSYIKAVNKIHKYGFKVSTHIMLFPSFENRSDYLNTVKVLNSVKTDGVKIHNVHVTSHTLLHKMYLAGEIGTSSVKRHVEDLAFILSHLNEDIIIQRLLTETPKQRLVAPLYFPDKRDIIEMLENYMKENKLKQGCLSFE